MSLRNQTCYATTALLASLFLAGCTADSRDTAYEKDTHSFARPNDVVTKHLELDLTVNFDTQKLTGTATLSIENFTKSTELHLDSRDLDIQKVTLDETGLETDFKLGDEEPYLGRPLVITIKPATKSVTIHYQTSPAAAAVQWLAPEQTAGGKHPFLFTQSQAILARTWIPCQDSPGIRITYSGKIKTDPGLMAVMSAENPTEKSADGIYHFNMPQPVPVYLLALAVGDLEFRSVGERSGVYAEPSVVAKAAAEFEDTEKMIEAAEKLYGPYRWGRYDIIVLPPSFPFGGMENPRLTFATPTILAGDKSLVALVAHELAHSWSGNLVTNATWDDFWLNEGFTTYFEHRIMEEVYGKPYAEMLASLSFQDLETRLAEMAPDSADAHLKLNLAGRDPDDGMSAIAYDKGHFFLRTIEKAVGREKWDSFLRSYFDKFAFQPTNTEKFLTYLRQELLKGEGQLEKSLEIDAWVYNSGIPDNIALASSEEFSKVEEQIESWKAGTPAKSLDTNDWTTHHWLHFLRNLPKRLHKKEMKSLDRAFSLTKSSNSEILNAWLTHVIANQYEAGYPALEQFLTSMGRRKFLKPLYEKMAENRAMLEMARLIYRKARPTYHSVATGTIDKILNWQS